MRIDFRFFYNSPQAIKEISTRDAQVHKGFSGKSPKYRTTVLALMPGSNLIIEDELCVILLSPFLVKFVGASQTKLE